LLASLAGQVFTDADGDGVLDIPAGDGPLPAVTVFLDLDANGQLDRSGPFVEPDDFATGQVLDRARPGVLLSATDDRDLPLFRVTAQPDSAATTGVSVFAAERVVAWSNIRRLRIDFSAPVASLSLDFIGATTAGASTGRLDLYDSQGQLLETIFSTPLSAGSAQTVQVTRPQQDIARAVAFASEPGFVKLDNLRTGGDDQEPWTMTAADGTFQWNDLDPGTYRLTQAVPAGYEQVFPAASAVHEVTLATEESAETGLNFGNQAATIEGLVFRDLGEEGTHEPDGPDAPLPGRTVFLDQNADGALELASVIVDPDQFAENEVLDRAVQDVILSADAAPTLYVTAQTDNQIGAGRVFAHGGVPFWNSGRRFRAEFSRPAAAVRIDFISGSVEDPEEGILQAYSVDGRLLRTVRTPPLNEGQRHTLHISRDTVDIGYVLAYGVSPAVGVGMLDDLRVQLAAEPATVTDGAGQFLFTPLAGGTYRVAVTAAENEAVTVPVDGVREVTLTAGATVGDQLFGLVTVGEPPVAVDDEATTPEGTPVDIAVLANDSSPEGTLDPTSVVVTQLPNQGQVTVDPVTGEVRYSPALGYVGADLFRYVVRDDRGWSSDPAAVLVTMQERDAPWQNPILAVDVNADGNVVPIDALLVINELNLRRVSDPQTGELLSRPVPPDRPEAYLDVDGDNFVVPRDALLVISELNVIAGGGAGEAEAARAAVAARVAEELVGGGLTTAAEDDAPDEALVGCAAPLPPPDYSSMPAMQPVMKAASVPPIIARKLSLARSALRSGAIPPMPPS
jgi:hypothetical protein